MADEVFSAEEAEAILERAARRRGAGGIAVNKARLRAMAEELDISPEELEIAIMERDEEREEARLRPEYIKARRSTIIPHLVPYLSVSFMLFMIWLLTSGIHSFPWFLIPMMGWGIGMATHVAAVWPTSGITFDAGFEEYKRKAAEREAAKTRRAIKRAAKNAESEKSDRAADAVRAAEQELAEATLGTTTYSTKPSREDDGNRIRIGQR